MTNSSEYRITKTRFEPLGLCNFGPALWRFCDLTDYRAGAVPSAVGPHYRTKLEAMSDLTRYATEIWGCEA